MKFAQEIKKILEAEVERGKPVQRQVPQPAPAPELEPVNQDPLRSNIDQFWKNPEDLESDLYQFLKNIQDKDPELARYLINKIRVVIGKFKYKPQVQKPQQPSIEQ